MAASVTALLSKDNLYGRAFKISGSEQGLRLQAGDLRDETVGGVGAGAVVHAGREQLHLGTVGAAQLAHGRAGSDRTTAEMLKS